jgi:hypothetical protein
MGNSQPQVNSLYLNKNYRMKKIPLFCLVVLFAISCNNNKTGNAESPDKKSGDATSAEGKNVISFKVNGDEIKTSGWNIRRFTWSNQTTVWMNITSDMHKEKRTINVNLNGATPGTYNFDDEGVIMEKSHGSYHADFNDPAGSYSFVGGSFVITGVDTVHQLVNGTFSVTAKNSKGEILNLTDGKIINGTLKPGIISL